MILIQGLGTSLGLVLVKHSTQVSWSFKALITSLPSKRFCGAIEDQCQSTPGDTQAI